MTRVKGVRDENGRVEFTPSGKLVIHGRASSYNNHGCHCQDCKSAWATYIYPRLKANREKRAKEKVREQKGTVRINL